MFNIKGLCYGIWATLAALIRLKKANFKGTRCIRCCSLYIFKVLFTVSAIIFNLSQPYLFKALGAPKRRGLIRSRRMARSVPYRSNACHTKNLNIYSEFRTIYSNLRTRNTNERHLLECYKATVIVNGVILGVFAGWINKKW